MKAGDMLVHEQASGKTLTNTYRICVQGSGQLPSHSLQLWRTWMLTCAAPGMVPFPAERKMPSIFASSNGETAPKAQK